MPTSTRDVRPARSAAAAALGTYPRRSAAARTRARVASDTRPRPTLLSTWLTVARETPASRATSALVTGPMRTGFHNASARDDRCPAAVRLTVARGLLLRTGPNSAALR